MASSRSSRSCSVVKDEESAREYYNALAKVYDELYGSEQYEKHRYATRLASPDGKRVLDAGCGTGELFRHCRKARVYIGLDIADKMVERAHAKFGREANANFIVATLTHLPLRDSSIDITYMITVMGGYLDSDEYLKDVRRVCRGAIIVSVHRASKYRPGVGAEAGFGGVDAFYVIECRND